jgi:hypothetical protein
VHLEGLLDWLECCWRWVRQRCADSQRLMCCWLGLLLPLNDSSILDLHCAVKVGSGKALVDA